MIQGENVKFHLSHDMEKLLIKIVYAERSEVEFFLEKLGIKALKLIIYVLNCMLGPPNLGVRPRPPLDPPVHSFLTALI